MSEPSKAPPPSDNAAEAVETSSEQPAYQDVTQEKTPEQVTHVEDTGVTRDKHRQAGESFIRQQHTIPTTGKRMLTSKWEYIFFCMFCKSSPPEGSLRALY